MALDHYISQVHLRRFIAPDLKNRVHAIRKSDSRKFTPRPQDVCRIEEGSTNGYLTRDRVIEDFLKTIEPGYNAALAALQAGDPDASSVYILAGFVAFITSCAPAAMRLSVPPLESVLRTTAEFMDRQGKLAPAPAILGGKTLSELLRDGTVHFDVDGKFPQAMGIDTILQRTSAFGNARWEILLNTDTNSPFFTSDFPAALEDDGTGLMNRLVPLAPDLAIRILPDPRQARAEPNLNFPNFRFRIRTLGRNEVAQINRLIVQCAENLVFYRDDHDWIEGFITKQKDFRIETLMDRIPDGRGVMHVARQRIRRRQAA
jgi:hypothetical protein